MLRHFFSYVVLIGTKAALTLPPHYASFTVATRGRRLPEIAGKWHVYIGMHLEKKDLNLLGLQIITHSQSLQF